MAGGWVGVQNLELSQVRHVQEQTLPALGTGWHTITAAQAAFELREMHR